MTRPATGGRPALADVVAAVNRERAAMGRPPIARVLRGVQQDPACCPLARSMDVWSVGLSFYSPTEKDGETLNYRVLPPVLARFVRAFDDGKYPELESRA